MSEQVAETATVPIRVTPSTRAELERRAGAPPPIRTSWPIYDWLAGLRADQAEKTGRKGFTYTEVLEQLRAAVPADWKPGRS